MGLPTVRYANGAFEGGIAKFLSDAHKRGLIEHFGLTENALLFFSCDAQDIVHDTLANLRIRIARDLGLIAGDKLNFVWVTGFPLLEYHAKDRRYYAKHHPLRLNPGMLNCLTGSRRKR